MRSALYTRESVMSANINVYCDGVYDLLHRGHINAYKNALKHGTRLFVGVCSDEDVLAYKRAPIMTTEERVHAVEMCKYVDKVIPNCPYTRGALRRVHSQAQHPRLYAPVLSTIRKETCGTMPLEKWAFYDICRELRACRQVH